MKALRELLMRGEAPVTLDEAALDLATIEHPGLDPEPWFRELDRLAFEIAGRADDLEDGAQFLQAANSYLFRELGFHGNDTHYYDPRNSCLNDVLAYRTGIPITLSVVYLEVARRLAKPVVGIGAPGHFLVRFDDGQLSAFIDPFNGGQLLRRDQVMLDDDALRPVSNRLIAIRMLNNLEGAYIRINDFEKALAVQELLRVALGA